MHVHTLTFTVHVYACMVLFGMRDETQTQFTSCYDRIISQLQRLSHVHVYVHGSVWNEGDETQTQFTVNRIISQFNALRVSINSACATQ